MRTKACVAAVLALLASAASGRAAFGAPPTPGDSPAPGASTSRPVILIDHSGSMKGFDGTGALGTVAATLEKAMEAPPELLWTVSEPGVPTRLIPDGAELRFGSETRLYESVTLALERWQHATSLWLLTDNIPSHESPDQDLDRLYDWLRAAGRPHAVTLFALKLPFSGPIYRSDGHTRLTSDYRGERAVVIYAALLDLAAKEQYRRDLDSVETVLAGGWPQRTLRLRCKPLQSDSVEMLIEDGSMHLDPDGILEGKGEEGESFRGTFQVKLRSKMDHVQFLNVKPFFIPSRTFITKDFDTSEVEATLSQHSIDEIGRGWVGLEGVLTIAPARLNRTLSSASKAFAKGSKPGVLAGYLDLRLAVDRKSVTILPADLHEFSTSGNIFADASPEVQSRVYRLQDLFQEKFVSDHLDLVPARGTPASGAPVALAAGRIPVRIVVSYSGVSAWVLLRPLVLTILAVLACTLLAGWLVSGQYRLIGDGLDPRPFPIRGSRPVRRQTGLVGTLFHLGPLLTFAAAGGWELGREGYGIGDGPGAGRRRRAARLRLPSRGGSVQVRRRGGDEQLSFRVVRLGPGGAEQEAGAVSFLK